MLLSGASFALRFLAPLLPLLLSFQKPDWNAEGMKALEAQKYDEAAGLFTQAAEADPADYAARFHLGLALSMLGRDAESAAAYRKTLEIKPGLYEAELNLGIVLLRQKLAQEAVAPLESAASKKPKEFRPAFYLAEALLAAGKPARAEPHYRTAVEADAKSAGAQLGLARTLAKLDRLSEAAQHFRQAAALDPEYRDALLELASLYEAAKQPLDAIAVYEQFPENVAARERLGMLLVEAGRPGDAIPHLEFAVEKSPGAANRVALAAAYLKNKQTEKAAPLLEHALSEAPEDVALRLAYGRALRDQKRYSDAAREFFRAAQAKPDSKEAWNELTGMLIVTENYPQALAALDRVRALGEETAAHHYFRAIVLDKMKQVKPALESYQRFLALSQNQNPDEEFKARQRVRILQKELNRR